MRLRQLSVLALVALTPGLALGQDTTSSSSASVAPLTPQTPISDADLERAVRAAYNGASAFAVAHGNYFSRDDVFPRLRDAVRAELLEEGWSQFAVPESAVTTLAAARACLAQPGSELRIVTTMFGDAVTLVAVTDSRDFVYAYDPHKAADIAVTPAQPCLKSN